MWCAPPGRWRTPPTRTPATMVTGRRSSTPASARCRCPPRPLTRPFSHLPSTQPHRQARACLGRTWCSRDTHVSHKLMWVNCPRADHTRSRTNRATAPTARPTGTNRRPRATPSPFLVTPWATNAVGHRRRQLLCLGRITSTRFGPRSTRRRRHRRRHAWVQRFRSKSPAVPSCGSLWPARCRHPVDRCPRIPWMPPWMTDATRPASRSPPS